MCFGALPAIAEHPKENLQNWEIVTFHKPITDRVDAAMEFQPRQSHVSDVDVLLLRPSIGYKVNDYLSVRQGYAWTPSFTPGFRSEHRVFQDIIGKEPLGKWTFTERARLEERFIENAGDPALRLRGLLQASHPIGHSETWHWVVFDEVWMNLNNTHAGPQQGFDQNWAFAGIRHKINSHLTVQGGYQLNYINQPRAARNQLNHVLVLSLDVNL
ncbi:MAG: DUF2490 domain-containing protein [Cyanobacteria bacterium HKST-UBA05]|nr:DUF2490 domain-containing protein [Cyanobacteria bacterium HKST-UBA05]